MNTVSSKSSMSGPNKAAFIVPILLVLIIVVVVVVVVIVRRRSAATKSNDCPVQHRKEPAAVVYDNTNKDTICILDEDM